MIKTLLLPACLCLCLCLLSPSLALANDSIAGVGVGGIVLRKTDVIAMKKEVLSIGPQLISVDYEFLNESSHDVEETIVFPLPSYPASSHMWDTYYGQPEGFSVKVNGQPVAFTSRLVAFIGEDAATRRDVTAELKQAGLSEAQIAFNGHFSERTKVPPLSAAQQRQLAQRKLFGELPDGETGPLWDVQVNYVWKQTFPAGKVLRVHHQYRPFVATGPGEWVLDNDFARTYCADKDFFSAYKALSTRSKGRMVAAAKVAYILQSGNNWKRGIEDFTLNIIKDRPQELISLCFPGTFKKLDARTYQVHLTNFHPSSDLKVYFGNVDGTGLYSTNGLMPVLAR